MFSLFFKMVDKVDGGISHSWVITFHFKQWFSKCSFNITFLINTFNSHTGSSILTGFAICFPKESWHELMACPAFQNWVLSYHSSDFMWSHDLWQGRLSCLCHASVDTSKDFDKWIKFLVVQQRTFHKLLDFSAKDKDFTPLLLWILILFFMQVLNKFDSIGLTGPEFQLILGIVQWLLLFCQHIRLLSFTQAGFWAIRVWHIKQHIELFLYKCLLSWFVRWDWSPCLHIHLHIQDKTVTHNQKEFPWHLKCLLP